MAKQATITEIAQRAGVSIGTVDRVLHNRPGVSKKSKERIQAILDEVGYKINLHTSAVALRKEYNIILTIPHSEPGEYWDSLVAGTKQAMEEYSDIHLACETLTYDQFDQVSCRQTFSRISEMSPDAVIIGPTFDAETHDLCSSLDKKGIPYIFVDTAFPDTKPLAAFTADQPAGGSLVGRLLDRITPKGNSIALIRSRFGSKGKAQNMEQRREGLMNYLKTQCTERAFLEADIDELDSLFASNTNIGGICVLNSRGHVIADYLQQKRIKGISIVAFDLTEKNIQSLKDGSIFALICQKPEKQGFMAVTTLLEYLLYRKTKQESHYLMPLDIVLRENLPYYQ